MIYYGLPAPFAAGLEDKIIAAVHAQLGDDFKAARRRSAARKAACPRARPNRSPRSKCATACASSSSPPSRWCKIPWRSTSGRTASCGSPRCATTAARTAKRARPTAASACSKTATATARSKRRPCFSTRSPNRWASPCGERACSSPPRPISSTPRTPTATARPTSCKNCSPASASRIRRPASTRCAYRPRRLAPRRLHVRRQDSQRRTATRFEIGNRDFRLRPDTGEIDAENGRTENGRVRDDWGNWFGCDNSSVVLALSAVRSLSAPQPACRAAAARGQRADRGGRPTVSARQAGAVRALRPGRQGDRRVRPQRSIATSCSAASSPATRSPASRSISSCIAWCCNPKGATFVGERAADEAESEFLASTDNWFRPVQARTGPDGALWIVDMYRYVIEHSRWIPQKTSGRARCLRRQHAGPHLPRAAEGRQAPAAAAARQARNAATWRPRWIRQRHAARHGSATARLAWRRRGRRRAACRLSGE